MFAYVNYLFFQGSAGSGVEDIELASLPSRTQAPIFSADANADSIVPCDDEVTNALQILDATIDSYDC